MVADSRARPSPILETHNLSKSFQGLQALQGCAFALYSGEILGVIGPNGAGKTTLFNLLTGFLIPTGGRVVFRNHDITAAPPSHIARLGLARTFQNIRVFGSLSVSENVKAAVQLRVKTTVWETLLGLPSFQRAEKEIEDRALALLDLFGLRPLRDRPAASLPYGDQRRLEIARALATSPTVLLLDEPAAGMNPAESDEMHRLILDLRTRFGLAIILVEHDMRLVMNVCERIVVLNYGQIIAAGKPEEVRNNPQVIESYLGKGAVSH